MDRSTRSPVATLVGRYGGILAALRRDARGNTLAMVAIAMIPLAGMVGGAMDLSRMYIAKTRLQHACDAGALAGRRAMGAGAWSSASLASAQQFFDGNYLATAYGGTGLSRNFTENAGRVTGTASITLPMTLTKVVGVAPTKTLTVQCDAQMKLPNTDIMFVLDTTGSMNCVAGDTSCTNNGGTPASGSKIDGLKNAVKCFYESVAQVNTNATCAAGVPTGNASSQVQIRVGFVPYSSNVNVGHLLPSSYFADTWKYQSRIRNTSTPSGWGDWSTYGYTQSTSGGTCSAQYANTSTTQYQSTHDYYNGYGWYCTNQSRSWVPNWDYKQVTTTVSGLKSGSGWNSTYSFTLPIENDGSNRTITWDGCIEERPTVRASSYDPIPSGAYDLNIDLKPTGPTDANGAWGPALQQLIYLRNIQTSYGEATTGNTTDTSNFYNNPSYTCPTEAKKLQVWPSATDFDDYVDSFVAKGNTYHDIGMLWGARLMSPTGIFSSENATTPSGGTIQRNMIFMTDGDSTASPCDYNAYGVPFYDQRQTTDVGPASSCGTNRQALIDQINARLVGLCTAVKAKGITLWVISYGGGTNAVTDARLQACASPADSTTNTHYYNATDTPSLNTAFTAIAATISQLRLVN